MRRILIVGISILVVVLIGLPSLLALTARPTRSPAPDPKAQGADNVSIKVYLPSTRQVVVMPLGEYLKGVVAAEMPARFQDEALKAQFVVARTYAVHRMHQFTGRGGCSLNATADVCADPATGQAYMGRQEADHKMGTFTASSLWQRLSALQLATDGLVVTYHGELIDPLYHSVSGKSTEDAGEYFSASLPYLKSVSDAWGADSPILHETKHFSLATLSVKLSLEGKAVTAASLTGTKALIRILNHTTTGRVKTLTVAGVTMTAREFRERLGLASTDFTVAVVGSDVAITTTGYGHGVGMSQYGANGMAEAGKTFKDILTYYYTGVTLTNMFAE
jgi:stage II sporulation protein D